MTPLPASHIDNAGRVQVESKPFTGTAGLRGNEFSFVGTTTGRSLNLAIDDNARATVDGRPARLTRIAASGTTQGMTVVRFEYLEDAR